MAYYRSVGDVPRTRHTAFRDDQGRLRYEELMGEEGFSSDSSLLYHSGVPSAIVDSQVWELPDLSTTPNHPLKPRHLKLHDLTFQVVEERAPASLETPGADAVQGRRLVLGNGDVRISYVVATAASPLYRNAIGDECVYVEAGAGTVETVFGVLSYRQGDYVVIPRATTHRWLPSEESRLYPIEASSHIAPPKRYLSRYGQLLEHAPYCERDLHGPEAPLVSAGSTTDRTEDVEVLVKHRGNGPSGIVGSRMTYATHPFDVVGWDGCLYPYTFNVEDFMPITGKVHQPPPVHQVFEGHNFVVCNFLPRKVDYHPQSIPVPYYHSNVDSDEVMFYVGGDYEARKGSGINVGSISLHPGGYAHGPQPSAVEASIGVEFFDESAVMVDTFRPLEIGEAGLAVEDPAYAWTWAGRGPEGDGPAVFSNS
ncbi:homogentisate 1,2-dioxygenase [Nocardioides pocheonensis]|uniref:Homogentisate 1,2-dioxygenase n=1 Tax=Nocardioides pocheonensis TaxID=661485 RepID=A0A3N0GMK9_9ACTN|nr:homogentisate 1,2-dioxygenase domain-containing protein [Nocardioides pocheonensis]RNM13687.1 homogentisate 1,2-dioxygenase [Nocardioides pocheonensis]